MTDWDKELAKIDRQLASISDEELLRSTPPAAPAKAGAGTVAAATAGASTAARAAVPRGAASPVAAGARAGKPWEAWVKVLVAVGAAAGLMYWPWPARCGPALVGFTAATGGVAALGVWSALGTWRHRLGWAHGASLLVTLWGLLLGAREVLPRVGYAVPTAGRPAQWSCDGLPPERMPVAPQVSPGPASGATPAGPTRL